MKDDAEQPKPKRKKTATYHDAAFAAFNYLLRKYVKSGDVIFEGEHQLSKRPPKIDIIVLKKNKNVKIETSWGRRRVEKDVILRKEKAVALKRLPDSTQCVYSY